MTEPAYLPQPLEQADGRFEIKFLADPDAAPLIAQHIRFHPAGFRKSFPERVVSNLYFDNELADGYDANLAGVSERAKVRLRWYASRWDTEGAKLEVKFKRNQIGWKLHFDAPAQQLRHGGSWRDFVTELGDGLPQAGAAWLAPLSRPVLINRYRRKYFISADNRFRITIDDRIETFNQWLSGRINLRCHPGRPTNVTVVELKFGITDRDRAQSIIDRLPLRRSRFSKYAEAAEVCLSP